MLEKEKDDYEMSRSSDSIKMVLLCLTTSSTYTPYMDGVMISSRSHVY